MSPVVYRKDYSGISSGAGQVTIPVEIRHSLGLSAGDKIAFVVDRDEVRMKPVKSVLDRSFGAVKPRRRPEDFQELEQLAEEAMAEDALRPLTK